MSYISAHVLDAAAGAPAVGVGVQLATASGEVLGDQQTNADGRVTSLGPDLLEPGDYRVTFGSGAYFLGQGHATFFPEVSVAFTVVAGEKHYHVPLLLSPYSYTTYRGS